MFELIYADTFERDLKALDNSVKEHLKKLLPKVQEDPTRFKPLHGFPHHHRLRFEKYRLIYKIDGNRVVLLFVRNRKEAYKALNRYS